ncbi:hypothetical protein LTR28_011257, partial [Elasticomyces elasticus]
MFKDQGCSEAMSFPKNSHVVQPTLSRSSIEHAACVVLLEIPHLFDHKWSLWRNPDLKTATLSSGEKIVSA